jgi:heme exporter protein A
MNITIRSSDISKKFNNRFIFKNISFSVSTSQSLAITGPNGSGKSTLLEIIAGIRKPYSGSIIFKKDGKDINISEFRELCGFSSFRLNLYMDLTAMENIEFAYIYSNRTEADDYFKTLLNKFGLYNDRNKLIKYYSSGMLQRLRFIIAIINNPHILLLDEPGSNLDSDGRGKIYSYLELEKQNKIIIIATNEKDEEKFCIDSISLYKQY